MGKALYRKYRPKSLSEVVGQKHITDTLANAIKSGRISHAYLLTGPRGTGKTSIARILAHEVNGMEYTGDRAELDIIEIDAASNRRIDEIRDLRDKVHILPTSNKYKVYIIDEVHMLTREAFNALLKTLEEPPEHAIFILATTEAHKLPETIVSRTQHFSFKPVEFSKVVEHLAHIAKGEKLKINTEALQLIAEHGEGSFRDSISLLDQARGLNDDIKRSDVEQLLGIAPAEATEQLLVAVQNGDVRTTLDTLVALRSQGFQSGLLSKQLSGQVRNRIIEDTSFQSVRSLALLQSLLGVSASAHADRLLEIALLEYIFAGRPAEAVATTSVAAASTPITDTPKTTKPAQPAKPAEPTKQPETKKSKPEAKQEPVERAATDVETPKVTKTNIVADSDFAIEAWPLVVAAVKKKYNTLYGILRMAEPRLENGGLTLVCKFAFHQKQINESKNQKIIGDIIKEQTGHDVTITVITAKKDEASGGKSASGTNNNTVSNVSDIFGGAEVLES